MTPILKYLLNKIFLLDLEEEPDIRHQASGIRRCCKLAFIQAIAVLVELNSCFLVEMNSYFLVEMNRFFSRWNEQLFSRRNEQLFFSQSCEWLLETFFTTPGHISFSELLSKPLAFQNNSQDDSFYALVKTIHFHNIRQNSYVLHQITSLSFTTSTKKSRLYNTR